MKRNRADPLYRKTIKLDRLKGVERCRDLKCMKKLSKSYLGSVERCPQQKDLDGLRSYQASRKFLEGSSNYRKAIENAIKRNWKSSINSLVVERCPAAV